MRAQQGDLVKDRGPRRRGPFRAAPIAMIAAAIVTVVAFVVRGLDDATAVDAGAMEGARAESAAPAEPSALTVENALTRAPAEDDASATPPQPAPAKLPIDDEDRQLLPKVMWRFDLHAGTPARVLANPALNPRGVGSDPSIHAILKQKIHAANESISKAEVRMREQRHELTSGLIDRGALPRAVRSAKGGYGAPHVADPEIEVGICGRDGDVFTYAFKWGDDPEYDQARLDVYEAKSRAVTDLREFLESVPAPTPAPR